MTNNLQQKLKDMGAENMMNIMKEKLSEPLVYLNSKEKLKQLAHVAQPFISTGLVILVCLVWLCSRCCRGKKPAKTMKAPGRDMRIARSAFEKNPKSYFRNLRKKEP